MILLALDQFTSKRRGSQAAIEEKLRPVVKHAVDLTEDTHGWDELLAEVVDLYTSQVYEESGLRHVPFPSGMRTELLTTLRKTTAPRDEATVERITAWLATTILSLATIEATNRDPEELYLEWVDMHDTTVRPTHRAANGQQRPIGVPFKVGGKEMPYPGYSGVDPSLWMNCRCTLRPVLASEAMSAALTMRIRGASHEAVALKYGIKRDRIDAYMTSEFRDVPAGERKKGAKSGTALPDGSFPIANCSDLKNAIQAIGRAKDPAKAKAHIRKRKSALGCPEVSLPDSWSAGWGAPSEDVRPTKKKKKALRASATDDKPCLCRGCDTFDCGMSGCACCWTLEEDGFWVCAPTHPDLVKQAEFEATWALETWAAEILGLPEVSQEEVDAQTSPMMHGFLADIRAQQQATKKPAVIVALPHPDDPIHQIGDEQKHATVAYLGTDPTPDQMDGAHAAVADYASEIGQPFEANVSGHGTLGPNGAQVMHVEHPELQKARDAFARHPGTAPLMAADEHPHYAPHVTTHYGDKVHPDAAGVGSIKFDRLAVWHGDQQTEYPLGETMAPTAPVKKKLDPEDVNEPPEDPNAPPDAEDRAEPPEEDDSQNKKKKPILSAVPWHGVLAPEGTPSGDGRQFNAGSLSHRDLPLPLTWQKISDDGHRGNVTVAKIEKIAMSSDGLMRASGHFMYTAEADEVIGLLGEFGRFGVSVDADDSTFEIDEAADLVMFTQARVCSACIVPIPAFAQAWVSLGEAPAEWGMDPVEAEPAPESLVAAVFGRGPGWLTNPLATQRIHDYWTVPGEPGYAKVGWGTEGDFNRCRVEIGEEIGENSPEKLRFISAICAQWQHDAIGVWPGKGEKLAAEALGLADQTPAPALSLVASIGHRAPAAWFTDPGFATDDGRMVQATDKTWGCPITVTDEGEVYGHIAKWGVCHIGFPGDCVTAPHSATGYSQFLSGEVYLDDGTRAPVGHLTIGGGHADGRLGMRAAIEHYDSTSTVWSDITVGEDEFGIWCHGWVRPGTSDDMVTAARASAVSGDWREAQPGDYEMIAALSVNSPGFSVPRVRIAASNGHQVSLVAAGAVAPREEHKVDEPEMRRLTAALVEEIAVELEQRAARRQRMAALATRINGE